MVSAAGVFRSCTAESSSSFEEPRGGEKGCIQVKKEQSLAFGAKMVDVCIWRNV